MGLDNGITLRVKGEINPDAEILTIPGIEKADLNDNTEQGFTYYEICYWRKCWNIRDILFANCHDAEGKEDCGEYSFTVDELKEVRDSLYHTICKGPEAWNEENRSIWTFEEAMNFLPWDIVRISALIDYLQHDGAGRSEVFFYDSY